MIWWKLLINLIIEIRLSMWKERIRTWKWILRRNWRRTRIKKISIRSLHRSSKWIHVMCRSIWILGIISQAVRTTSISFAEGRNTRLESRIPWMMIYSELRIRMIRWQWQGRRSLLRVKILIKRFENLKKICEIRLMRIRSRFSIKQWV